MENSGLQERFITYLGGYKKLIVKVASAYCFETEDRKDLIQEISLQLWKAYPGYDASVALSTWTYRIALNVSISFLRKEISRSKKVEQYQQQRDILEWSNPVMDERLEQLYRIIDQLQPLDKALIISESGRMQKHRNRGRDGYVADQRIHQTASDQGATKIICSNRKKS